MPNDLPCSVPWCDHECRWEFETDDLPTPVTVHDQQARGIYLAGFGHPPFRWHSRLWPSGLCLEQNEFLPGTDPLYVAEHGRPILSGTTLPADPNPADDPAAVARVAESAAQLAVDFAEAVALLAVPPSRVRPLPTPGAPEEPTAPGNTEA